jgi:hypothetical protein
MAATIEQATALERQRTKVAPSKSSEAKDHDGRRRVVFNRDERRAIDRAINILAGRGLGMIVACKPRDAVPALAEGGPQPARCGLVMTQEGHDGDGKRRPDAGWSCQCSRVHFLP